MDTTTNLNVASPHQGLVGSHLQGPFQTVTVGVWFYRNTTWLSRAIRLLGNTYSHVTARVGPCVYEQRINQPADWYWVADWEAQYPPVVRVEWQQDLHVPLVDTVCTRGETVDLWGTIKEYLCPPVYPTAQNCLAGARNLLRVAGRNCDATTPDELYRQVLDLGTPVRHAGELP